MTIIEVIKSWLPWILLIPISLFLGILFHQLLKKTKDTRTRRLLFGTTLTALIWTMMVIVAEAFIIPTGNEILIINLSTTVPVVWMIYTTFLALLYCAKRAKR
jgi:hypothetical protein